MATSTSAKKAPAKSAVSAAVKAKPKAAPVKSAAAKKAPLAVKSKPVVKKPAAAKNKSTKPVKLAKPSPAAVAKVKKPKLVRDSFTMPEAEYQVLGDIKKACLKAGIAVKKSELLRVGVALLKGLDSARLKDVIAALPPLKAGRPKQEK